MNDFEKYLSQNKQKLLVSEVNPKIWDHIEQQMPSNVPKNSFRLLKLVSGIAAVLLVAFILFKGQFSTNEIDISKELLSQYGFEDKNINETLEQKIQLIANTEFSTLYKEDLQLLYDQIAYLDKSNKSKVKYLQNQDYDENIAKEVLAYYQLKSRLLDKIMAEMKTLNNNDEKFEIRSEKSNITI